MSARHRLDRWAFASAAFAVASYCLASRNVELGAIALFLAGLRWVLSRGGRPVAAPRWLVNVAATGAVLWTLGRALGVAGTRLDVDGFSVLLTLLILGKLFDWTRVRDAAQLLMLSAFLGIGAVLTSNELIVFATVAALSVALAIGAAWFQLALGETSRARSRRVAGLTPARVGGVGDSASDLLARVLRVAMPAALVISIVVFLLVPRGLGDGLFGEVRSPALGDRVAGFNDRVQLGAGGLISDSPTIVMDLVVSDSYGRRKGGLYESYYLRGAILDRYDPDTGAWEATPGSAPALRTRAGHTFPLAPGGQDALVQEITIRSAPDGESYLFGVWSPSSISFGRSETLVVGQARTHALRRRGRGGKLQYTIQSAIPAPMRSLSSSESLRFEPLPDQWPRVRELAHSMLRDAGLDPDEIRAIATASIGKPVRPGMVDEATDTDKVPRAVRALAHRLSRDYAYTLEPPATPRGQDPVEWFLLESREGHCEYFAAGLTAMCRSVGIGARVVTGYLATEYNESTEHYVVRASNAHAWVEAEMAPGTWRTVDPTPEADLTRIHDPAQDVWAQLGRLVDAVEYAWINSVVGFDEDVRSQMLGFPRIEQTRLARRVQALGRRLDAGGPGLIARAALNASLAFAGTLVGGWILIAGSVWVYRSWGSRGGVTASTDAADILHLAVLRALSRAGRPKPVATPLGRFAESLEADTPGLAELARRAALTLYPVRFGGRPMTPEIETRTRELIAEIQRTGRATPAPA